MPFSKGIRAPQRSESATTKNPPAAGKNTLYFLLFKKSSHWHEYRRLVQKLRFLFVVLNDTEVL